MIILCPKIFSFCERGGKARALRHAEGAKKGAGAQKRPAPVRAWVCGQTAAGSDDSSSVHSRSVGSAESSSRSDISLTSKKFSGSSLGV